MTRLCNFCLPFFKVPWKESFFHTRLSSNEHMLQILERIWAFNLTSLYSYELSSVS